MRIAIWIIAACEIIRMLQNAIQIHFKMRDGNYIRLKVEVSDKCPEWAREILEKEKDE